MVLKIAIRNIFAYRKRSLVTVLLTCFSTALLVFASAIWDGSHNKMIENAVEIYPGYMQITGAGFRENPGLEDLIFDAGHVRKVLENLDGVGVFGERFETFVLYSSKDKSVGGMFTGIEPGPEISLSRLSRSLKEGEYLDDDDQAMLYIGKDLARRLKVGVGDSLAFVGTGADYSFAADSLTVKGIFQTGLFEFDSGAGFVNKKYFDVMMASENLATHFIVLPEDPGNVEKLAAEAGRRLGPEYQSAAWQQTMAPLVQAMLLDSIFGYITLGVIFIVIFAVILIYTWLTIFARVREIGIMRAIGTTPRRVLNTLITESVILGIVSVLIGGFIGGCLAWYFQMNPIEFSGYEEQFKQYGLAASAMPAEFAPLTIVRDVLIMFFLSVLSTLYPILRVNRLQPVEAIHHV